MQFKLANQRIIQTEPYLIWGILNLSPESFSHSTKDDDLNFIDHAQKMLDEGAFILDIGAESTNPKASPLSAKIEQDRLLPKLQELIDYRKQNKLDFLISVDSYKASSAKQALDLGCEIINDISGFSFDAQMLEVLLEYQPTYVLGASADCYAKMHEINPKLNIVEHLLRYFEQKIAILARNNFPLDRLILDPCIGFGKDLEQNLQILQNIASFNCFELPILIGLSRKRMFADLFNLELHERDAITATACALLLEKKIEQHRVHKVATTKQALELALRFRSYPL